MGSWCCSYYVSLAVGSGLLVGAAYAANSLDQGLRDRAVRHGARSYDRSTIVILQYLYAHRCL